MICLNISSSIVSTDEQWISHDQTARICALIDKAGLPLLLITVGTLLIRPADLLPALDKAPIYEWLIVGCILLSLPQLARQLTVRSLGRNSVTVMLLLFGLAVMLSHLVHADTYDARIGTAEVGKAFLLFLLIISQINTAAKLQMLLWVVMAGVFVEALLAVGQHHGLIHLAALQGVEERWHDVTSNESLSLNRLCGIGVFHDPNDFSLILVVAMVFCVYAFGKNGQPSKQIIILGAMGLFAYAFALTRSRGGLTAAAAAIFVFSTARFGWRNSIVLVLLCVPALMLVSSRQTDLDLNNPEDTFQSRLGLWSDSFQEFRSEPLFGIGERKLDGRIGHVCHNSYIHAFTETGVIGGTAFAGAFYLVLRGLAKAKSSDPQLNQFMPYLLALVASYAVGLLSLSRCYTAPTQLILALGTVGLLLAAREGQLAIPRFNAKCIRQVSKISGLLLLFSYLFVRVMITR